MYRRKLPLHGCVVGGSIVGGTVIIDHGPCECCGKFTPCETCNGIYPTDIYITITNATGAFEQLNNVTIGPFGGVGGGGIYKIDYTSPLPLPRDQVQYSMQNSINGYLQCCPRNHKFTFMGFAVTDGDPFVYGEIDRWLYAHDPANGFDGNLLFVAYTYSCPPNLLDTDAPDLITVYSLECSPFMQDMHIHVDAMSTYPNYPAGDMDWLVTE